MACWQRIPSISGSRELDFPPTIVPCADHRLSSLLAGIKAPIRSDASQVHLLHCGKILIGSRRECKMIKAEANQQRRNHDAAVRGGVAAIMEQRDLYVLCIRGPSPQMALCEKALSPNMLADLTSRFRSYPK